MAVTDGDILVIVPRVRYGVSDMMCTFHVRANLTNPADSATVAADAAAWCDDAWDSLNSLMNENVTYLTVGVRNLTEDTPMIYESWPTMTVGGNAGAALPLQCAALLNFPTSISKVQGRKYLMGFISTTNGGGGEIVAGLVTALALWADTVMDGFTTGDGNCEAGVYNEDLARFATYQSVYYNSLFRTQRRRVEGVGM